jgi:acetyl esterase/lipase
VKIGADLIAGKPITGITNVARPMITVYAAQGQNTGAAVVVFPGGGYRMLAIDLEGTEVCDWLTPKGITCVLLKYRVPGSAEYWDEKLKREVNPKVYTALQDAQRTIGLVRHRAEEWKIDPRKIGVLGSSRRSGQHEPEARVSGAGRSRQRELSTGLCGGHLSRTFVG